MDIGCDGLHNLMDRLEQLEADENCTCYVQCDWYCLQYTMCSVSSTDLSATVIPGNFYPIPKTHPRIHKVLHNTTLKTGFLVIILENTGKVQQLQSPNNC